MRTAARCTRGGTLALPPWLRASLLLAIHPRDMHGSTMGTTFMVLREEFMDRRVHVHTHGPQHGQKKEREGGKEEMLCWR